MATWNRAELLHIPIESCLNQTYEDWDLWVMDDASTDNTKEVVEGYKDPRIHYVKLSKQDYYTIVRNKGIEASDGELLAFRDSDGGWAENFLEELARPHKNEDVAVSYCGRKLYQGVDLKAIRYKDLKDLKPTKIVKPAIYRGEESISNIIDVGDMIIKRKVFSGEFQGFSEKKDLAGYCSDARLVDNIERHYPKGRFILIDKPLHYYFYKHDGKVENMTDTKLRLRAEGKPDNDLERLWEF